MKIIQINYLFVPHSPQCCFSSQPPILDNITILLLSLFPPLTHVTLTSTTTHSSSSSSNGWLFWYCKNSQYRPPLLPTLCAGMGQELASNKSFIEVVRWHNVCLGMCPLCIWWRFIKKISREMMEIIFEAGGEKQWLNWLTITWIKRMEGRRGYKKSLSPPTIPASINQLNFNHCTSNIRDNFHPQLQREFP